MSTKAEKARFDFLSQTMGCICCILEGHYQWGDVHHVVDQGYRKGHGDTIGLCPWHHRGVQTNGLRAQQMAAQYGPSLHHGSKPFSLRYGGERFLLKLVNYAYEKYQEEAFIGVPLALREDLRGRWKQRIS